MNRKFLIAVGIVVLFIGAGFWLYQVQRQKLPASHEGHEQGPSPKSQIKKAAKEKYYCPMHPTYISDRPGDCPICQMRLVKAKEEPTMEHEGHEEALAPAVPKTPEEAKTICLMHDCPMEKAGQPCPMMIISGEEEEITCPVCKEKIDKMRAKKVPISQSPEGYVSVIITPEKQQLIGVKTEKLTLRPLTKVIRTVGRIAYDPELYQAQQEYLQAFEALKQAETGAPAAILENAKRLVDSGRIRLRLLGLNDDLIEEVKQAGKPDSTLLLSGEDSWVWLYATVYESELALVKSGQEITATTPNLPGKEFSGVIRAVDPVLDPKTRSVRVRARLENPESLLKPEMYMNVVWKINLGEHLAVPQEAVLISGQNNVVFVDRGSGRFDPRRVKLGIMAEGYYAVLAGLSVGETIVTNGNFLIDSESRLKSALEGMGHQH